jgi:hypothetical protein
VEILVRRHTIDRAAVALCSFVISLTSMATMPPAVAAQVIPPPVTLHRAPDLPWPTRDPTADAVEIYEIRAALG